MLMQHGAGMGVYLAEGYGAHTRALKPEAETAYPRKQI